MSLEFVWQLNIPPSLRGTTYTFVAVNSVHAVTLLVTRSSSAYLIQCWIHTCVSKSSSPVLLPLAAGDDVQQVFVTPYAAYKLLLVSPNMAIPFDTRSMTVSEKPMDWTRYSTFYRLKTVTSLTALTSTLFISLGTSSEPQGVGAIVSLSHPMFWSFSTITFFIHTPSNMGSNGATELYWAQTTNTSGLLWTWPNREVAETPFAKGEQWSSRIAPQRSLDGTILLASGNTTSHAGFTFWTPVVQLGLDLGAPQPFTSQRGWALPYLSRSTSQGIVVTSKTSQGIHDLLFCQWGIHPYYSVEKGYIPIKKELNNIIRSESRKLEVSRERRLISENCRPSTCELDTPGDCAIGQCWGTGGKGDSFVCCKHPPV